LYPSEDDELEPVVILGFFTVDDVFPLDAEDPTLLVVFATETSFEEVTPSS